MSDDPAETGPGNSVATPLKYTYADELSAKIFAPLSDVATLTSVFILVLKLILEGIVQYLTIESQVPWLSVCAVANEIPALIKLLSSGTT